MGLSVFSILQSLILVLIGTYIGINIAQLHNQSNDTTKPPESRVTPGPTNSIRRIAADEGDDNPVELRKQLEKSLDEIKRWQSIAQNMTDRHGSSLQKLREVENLCSKGEKNKSDLNPAKANTHPVCQSITSNAVPTAMDLWNQHIPGILSASRLPRDTKFMYHDFTAQILQIISPRLPRSVKTTPFDWRPVENALTVAWERYQYLQLPKKERDAIAMNDKPRPLKILVMGGSLLVGTNCGNMNREMNFQFGMPRRECNWSSRVRDFLNMFFLGEDDPKEKDIRTEQLFEVAKVAMGGTNTATGSVIWQYDLIPEEARDPDVVINAYSTNDMHILTILEAESSNTTLREKTFEMIQGFVRQVMGSKYCTSTSDELISPLLLHMDDYLGNEQRKIWETTELGQGAQVLANYYGFVSMSYADVIREFVYGDTYETWFSSEWWVPDKSKKGKRAFEFERQIHPGMGMHISAVWVTAYNLLHLVSSYCSIPTDALLLLNYNNISEYRAGVWGLPNLDMRFKQPKGQPQPQPKGLPPELTKELLLEDVTSLWRQQSNTGNAKEVEDNQQSLNSVASLCKFDKKDNNGVSSKTSVKCPFAWVSGLSLQQNNVTWVQEYFKRQSSIWQGWEISEDGKKVGFIPSVGANATMILDFSYSQRIKSITFFFMKSYGSKWEHSKLEAKIWSSPSADQQNQILLEERNMLGTHNKNTSEMYTDEIVFSKPIDAESKIQVEAKLVGGQMFKLMGLAVCS